jgi:NAD(P)-dependent dehydrogenase (short-subunit alcohol dehydrogenase family)
MVSAAVEAFGGIDVLVNNAGIDIVGNALDLLRADFESVMRFNVDVNFATTRAAGRVMIESGGGKVINITSVFSAVAIRDDVPYIASKHALLGLTRALALEWARANVQVNALAPGFVPTEMTRAEVENETAMRSVVRRIPMGRPCQPEELVGAAIFLASRASDYMTGQTLFVDGGWTVQ